MFSSGQFEAVIARCTFDLLYDNIEPITKVAQETDLSMRGLRKTYQEYSAISSKAPIEKEVEIKLHTKTKQNSS